MGGSRVLPQIYAEGKPHIQGLLEDSVECAKKTPSVVACKGITQWG